MTDRELMQMALDALRWCYDVTEWPANGESPQDKAIEALRAALAQPEPEPVAWLHTQGYVSEPSDRELFDDEIKRGWTQKPLYTVPPQREWQGLTDEEVAAIPVYSWGTTRELVDAITAMLKEKNT